MVKYKKILLYGQGNGRDHINHIELMKSKGIEVISLIKNENALMEQYENVKKIKDLKEAVIFAKEYKPDLVMISNRADLAEGATEVFQKAGFKVFGISKKAAHLETCKEYAKEFMKRNNISTPNYYITSNEEEAIKYVSNNWNKTKYGYVFKVDQFSKNSFARTAVPNNLEEAIEDIHRLFSLTQNCRLIIEEKIKGYELSVHVFINKDKYSILPMVQDYKKKYPNEEGPMTAGTVSVAEGKSYPTNIEKQLKKDVIEPTIKGMKKENIEYDYILYIGVMVTDDGKLYVLEYNTRTGNPEWLALLGLLNKPFIEVINLFYEDVEKINSCWKKKEISIAMYGFSAGYPEVERSNFNEPILFLDKVKKTTDVIGEHIVSKNNILYPSGGRVFALRRVGKDFEKVKNDIIKDFYKIKMNGLYFRYDIKQI
ncbi:phosphoribosylamine-glycine ligase [Clostridium sp. CAG:440]|mgnify:FL=1|nr:phosphoribosylamine-glycine ligase [Clostridium sp. CAG:440]